MKLFLSIGLDRSVLNVMLIFELSVFLDRVEPWRCGAGIGNLITTASLST